MKSYFQGLSAATALWSSMASAGWVSGGGQLTTDANNPWFLANTGAATYCVEVANEGFPYDEVQMQAMVEETLAYWRSEFAKELGTYPVARVATQVFQHGVCNRNTDIKFQFGFLTAEQIRVIPNFSEHISLAVRTAYDSVNLRGRGFIYVAAEAGLFRPAGNKILPKPWQECDGCRLKRVLAHELGHVFGIPHVTTDFLNLMSPEYPEIMTSKVYPPEAGKAPTATTPLPFFFAHSQDFSYVRCEDPRFGGFARIRRFFDLPASDTCIKFQRRNDDYALFAAPDAGASFRPVGNIEVEELMGKGPALVRIHLTARQRVLPPSALEFPYIASGSISRYEASATFTSPTGKRTILIRTDPHTVSVDGFDGNAFHRDLINQTRPH